MADQPNTPDADRDQIVLGRALRELRARVGITQGELAARMGIDLTYVSRIERGKRGVRWHTAMRFLAALDSNLHQLADVLDEQSDRPPR